MLQFKRTLQLRQVAETKSLFLLGARQTGKSTLVRSEFPDALLIDLLEADTFRQLMTYPERLREFIAIKNTSASLSHVIIDEIQKVPALLDEVHRLIERHKNMRFILTGSSARKLRRAGVNLLGGRARRLECYPITTQEFLSQDQNKDFLGTFVQFGCLPSILSSSTPKEDLKDYVGTYLKEEIQAEALVRSLENFSRFLDVAALTNTEQLNYAAVASDAGLPSRTVQEYFQLLEDTLIGKFLPPYQGTKNRKAMTSPKFFLFDIGVANAIVGRWSIGLKTPEFGKSFEHLVWRELTSMMSYHALDFDLFYWRSENKFEVDFILQEQGNKEPCCAIEVKAKSTVTSRDFVGLQAFGEEFKYVRKIVVSLETHARKTDEGIEIWPAKAFFAALWRGEILAQK